MKSKAGLLANLFLSLLCVALTLFAADAGIKAYLKVPSDYLKKIVRFDQTLSPDKRLYPDLNLSVTGAFREFRFHVTTGADGFRKGSIDGVPEIFVFGDSQTFGIGVGDEETFSSRLSKLSGKPVLNTGCPGYNTHEEFLLTQELLKKNEPKQVVLAFFAGNDPYENFKNAEQPTGGGSAAPLPHKKMLARLKDKLVAESSLYNLMINLRRFRSVNRLFLRLGLVNDAQPAELEIFKKADTFIKKKHWDKTEIEIRAMRNLAASKNAGFTVLFIPDRYQVDEPYWKQWVAKYRLQEEDYDRLGPNAHLKAFLESEKIPMIDATQALRDAEAKGERMYWKIDNHLNPAGHRVIAETLAAYFKPHEQA